MKITFVGTGHGDPTKERDCTSILIQADDGSSYLLDGGCDISFKLIKKDIEPWIISKIFITHMHSDHVAGIPGLFKFYTKYGHLDKLTMYFPDEGCKDGFKVWIKTLGSRANLDDFEGFKIVEEGEFCSDENLKVRAIRTEHVDNLTSYAYIFELDGKKVGFTGDLSGNGDFHDFPKEFHNEELDLVVCEMTHMNVDKAFEQIKKCKTRELVFNHVGGPKKIEAVSQRLGELPFEKVTIAYDGMEYNV